MTNQNSTTRATGLSFKKVMPGGRWVAVHYHREANLITVTPIVGWAIAQELEDQTERLVALGAEPGQGVQQVDETNDPGAPVAFLGYFRTEDDARIFIASEMRHHEPSPKVKYPYDHRSHGG